MIFRSQKDINATDGINIKPLTVTISMSNATITYVVGIEYGSYPDATIELLEGGPGYSFVKVIIAAGPSQGWNYTISIFGLDLGLPKNVEITTMKLEKYSRFI
jgi:Transcription activator MBF2